MKVFVEVSCEIDPTVSTRIDRTSGRLTAEPGDRLLRVSLRGRLGIETALSVAGAQVTAFALGEGHEEALRHALAAGATDAIQLIGGLSGKNLAAWIAQARPDLIIGDRVVSLAATRLGWAHLAGVESMEISEGRLLAVRGLGRGDRERVEARLPAVVRLEQCRAPRYIARARLKRELNREIASAVLTTEPAAGAVETGGLSPVRPRTRLGAAGAPAPVPARASDRLQALMGGIGAAKRPAAAVPAELARETPEGLADSFVRYLAHHGLLEVRS